MGYNSLLGLHIRIRVIHYLLLCLSGTNISSFGEVAYHTRIFGQRSNNKRLCHTAHTGGLKSNILISRKTKGLKRLILWLKLDHFYSVLSKIIMLLSPCTIENYCMYYTYCGSLWLVRDRRLTQSKVINRPLLVDIEVKVSAKYLYWRTTIRTLSNTMTLKNTLHDENVCFWIIRFLPV